MRAHHWPLLTHWLRFRNRCLGLDRYPDPYRYFDRGGVDGAFERCREIQRDVLAWIRPPRRAEARRVALRALDDVTTEVTFDSPCPSGRAANDRVRVRVWSPRRNPTSSGPCLLFHHPMYQRRWEIWRWFTAPAAGRLSVAALAAPNHFERAGCDGFPGEWTMNPNPLRMYEAVRQWAWDRTAMIVALEDTLGVRPVATVGYSLGAFQSLMLAASIGIEHPIVAIASTNRYAWGLLNGVLGEGLVAAKAKIGIDADRLVRMTEGLVLERHVSAIAGGPIMNVRGLDDPVDPAPSGERLERALRPKRALALRAGHGSLVTRRATIWREGLDFLAETGAIAS